MPGTFSKKNGAGIKIQPRIYPTSYEKPEQR